MGEKVIIPQTLDENNELFRKSSFDEIFAKPLLPGEKPCVSQASVQVSMESSSTDDLCPDFGQKKPNRKEATKNVERGSKKSDRSGRSSAKNSENVSDFDIFIS